MELHEIAESTARMDAMACVYITTTPWRTYIKVGESKNDAERHGAEDGTIGYGGLPTREHIALAGILDGYDGRRADADDMVVRLGRTDADGRFIGEPARIYVGNWSDQPSANVMQQRIADAIITNDELRWAVVGRAIDKELDALNQQQRDDEDDEGAQWAKAKAQAAVEREIRERFWRRCICATN